MVKAQIVSSAHHACLEHVMTTEAEEMMGLLIGEYLEETNTVRIYAPKVLKRLDKRPDRVEISAEDLALGLQTAEQLAEKTGNAGLRVLGWYHSHPRITVWPSHVDLRTQENFQQMESNFLGVIFSVFVTCPKTMAHTVEMTCFQSGRDQLEERQRVDVPFEVVPDEHYEVFPAINLLERITVPEVMHGEVSDALAAAVALTEKSLGGDKYPDCRFAQANLSIAAYANDMKVIDMITIPLLNRLRLETELMGLECQRLDEMNQMEEGNDSDEKTNGQKMYANDKDVSVAVAARGLAEHNVSERFR